jgi:hypothetical protein
MGHFGGLWAVSRARRTFSERAKAFEHCTFDLGSFDAWSLFLQMFKNRKSASLGVGSGRSRSPGHPSEMKWARIRDMHVRNFGRGFVNLSRIEHRSLLGFGRRPVPKECWRSGGLAQRSRERTPKSK